MPRLPGPRCKHVKINGTRCECAALREKAYCYFHFRARQRRLAPPLLPLTARAQEPGIEGPPTAEGMGPLSPPRDLFLLEDANAIQCAVEWVLGRILDGSVEHRRAALLLHGLQIASENIKLTNFHPLASELIKSAPAEWREEESG